MASHHSRTFHSLRPARWLSILSATLVLFGAQAAQATNELRIGFQKSSSLLILLKSQGTLEKQLAPLGVQVKWHEFSSGLPLLEGVNVGSIDLSADVAETVPLFA